MEYFFHTGRIDEAIALVKKFHYSHRAPSLISFVGTLHIGGGLYGDYGPAVAAALFSIPPTRWSEKVLELSRLVRHESHDIPLTKLISLAKREVNKITDLVVSFADWTQGHHGGIYQACSWNYGGKRDSRCDGVLINGKFVPGRSCNSTYGTRSPEKLRKLLTSDTIEPHYDMGKHIYWCSLSRSGDRKAARLGLQKLPYPKPDK